MSISDNKPRDCQGPQEKNNSKDVSSLAEDINLRNVDLDKEAVWMESLTPLNTKLHNADLLAGSSSSAMRKVAILPQQIPLSARVYLVIPCLYNFFSTVTDVTWM